MGYIRCTNAVKLAIFVNNSVLNILKFFKNGNIIDSLIFRELVVSAHFLFPCQERFNPPFLCCIHESDL